MAETGKLQTYDSTITALPEHSIKLPKDVLVEVENAHSVARVIEKVGRSLGATEEHKF